MQAAAKRYKDVTNKYNNKLRPAVNSLFVGLLLAYVSTALSTSNRQSMKTSYNALDPNR